MAGISFDKEHRDKLLMLWFIIYCCISAQSSQERTMTVSCLVVCILPFYSHQSHTLHLRDMTRGVAKKKRQYADITEKHDKNIRSDYGSSLSELEVAVRDVVRQETSFHDPIGNVLPIPQQDDHYVSKRIAIYVAEYLDTSLRFSKQRDLRTASELIYLFIDT